MVTNSRKLPGFKSVQEMAEFFDRTDLTELDLKPVEVKYNKEEGSASGMVQVSLRLSKHDLTSIRKLAQKAGVGHTTFIRMLIKRAIDR